MGLPVTSIHGRKKTRRPLSGWPEQSPWRAKNEGKLTNVSSLWLDWSKDRVWLPSRRPIAAAPGCARQAPENRRAQAFISICRTHFTAPLVDSVASLRPPAAARTRLIRSNRSAWPSASPR